jgi:hypothetical protein
MSESYYKIHVEDIHEPGSVIISTLAHSAELEGDLHG